MAKAEQITGPEAGHGEGPVWSTTWCGLCFVDMLVGDVLRLDRSSGSLTRWHVGKVAAALRPRGQAGAVLATEREFMVCEEIGGELVSLSEVFDDPKIRFNDGACDPAGNFLCGTMAYDEHPGSGILYRLGADHAVSTVLTGVTISNGLDWTVDSSRAYYVDTPTGRIDMFDSDLTGELANRRPFVTIESGFGSPDGLTVDAQGGVWTALWGGSAVHHYSAFGVLQDVIDLPTANVTACTFGGDNLDELFITTSREGADPRDAAAGALFRYLPGVEGVPALPFAG